MAKQHNKGATDSAKLMREIRKLDASTEEEVDALKVDLFPDDERPNARDGSGLVVDELAEEEIAKFTEVGPLQPDRGVESLVPGRDNTSTILRRHHPNTEVARAEDVLEGNLDEPRNETEMERKVDEGTAA
jgi:transcription termination/antitermination protein NusA